MSGTTRFENVYMAQLAEQSDRWDDMAEYMKRIAAMGAELSLEERRMFAVAYKNSVSVCRDALRSVKRSELELSKSGRARQDDIEAVKGYYSRLGAELNDKCNDVLEILGKDLLPTASTADGKIFFQKLKGDYHRYLAEFASGDSFAKHSSEAKETYQAALSLAEKELAPKDQLRLGLALNFSIFLHEVMSVVDESSRLQAVVTAKNAYDAGLREYNRSNQKDDEALKHLYTLRGNIDLWTAKDDGTGVEDL